MIIVIVGGGICGLGTALLLARDGHDVTVVERDTDPLPDSAQEAWEGWTRKGVAQFRQPHNFMPGLRLLFDAELPDIQDALRSAGASKYDLLNPLPPFFADRSPRAIDEKLWTYTARRPVAEWVFAKAAQNERRVTIRRGLRVTELISGPSAMTGTPHVVGIRTAAGEELRADLVVDASGRQSRSPEWLIALGARPPYEEKTDSGFVYYTRYFHGTQPQRMAPGLTALGSISLLTLPGDNDTWSVTVFGAAGDQPLKNLRHDETLTNVVRACPLHAHWLDGQPITSVLAMSGVVDRYRRFVSDGTPVATGFVAVADAWACTNPSAGRGLTVGFLHAACLRDVLRDAPSNPRTLVEAFDEKTEADIAPWYYAQIANDRARFAEMEVLRNGREPGQPSDPLARDTRSFFSLMGINPDFFRAGLEYIGTITPVQEILKRSDVAEAVNAVQTARLNAPPLKVPGPDRNRLLELLS
jgi:2-polyprenyl-6-methoxyphenol hydroxylase-like FAD-dependent oxidoreductase